MFQRCKLRLTALDDKARLILRVDMPFYHDFAVVNKSEEEKYRQAREKALKTIEENLEKAGIKQQEGEYHAGTAEW